MQVRVTIHKANLNSVNRNISIAIIQYFQIQCHGIIYDRNYFSKKIQILSEPTHFSYQMRHYLKKTYLIMHEGKGNSSS